MRAYRFSLAPLANLIAPRNVALENAMPGLTGQFGESVDHAV
jgi:hypothetical protein